MININLSAYKFKKFESFKYYLFSSIFFRIILEYSYINFVSELFSYSGFVFDFGWIKYFESWLLFIFIIIFSSSRLSKPSDYLIGYLIFSYIIPLLIYYSYSNAERIYLYFVLLSFALILIFKNGRPLKISFFKNGENFAFGISVVSSIFVSLWFIFSGGLKFVNFDLSKVYEYRQDVGEVLNVGPMGYLNIWASKVFGPFLMAFALWRSKYVLALIVFVLHIFWFAVSSHKSVLFYPFLILFVWYWFKNSKALAIMPIVMSIISLTFMILYILTEEIFLSSIFLRRFFFVPAHLTFTYYDFFSQYDFLYWSNSILSNIIKYPYDKSPALLIGIHLDTDAAANNSFLSTGYMHAGVFGVIVYGILVGFLFRLIDSLAYEGVPTWVAVACLIVPSHALLTSADLPTAILTHGIAISLLLLLLIRKVPR